MEDGDREESRSAFKKRLREEWVTFRPRIQLYIKGEPVGAVRYVQEAVLLVADGRVDYLKFSRGRALWNEGRECWSAREHDIEETMRVVQQRFDEATKDETKRKSESGVHNAIRKMNT